MTRLSAHISSIVGGGDDGWGVHHRAIEKIKAGEDVLLLSIGDHDFSTAEPVVDACVEALRSGRHHYGTIAGETALRKAVAERVSRRAGIEVKYDEVVITPGGQAALYAAAVAALDPGAEAIVIEPYYATYEQTMRAAAGHPVVIPALPEDGFQPRPEAIEAALTPATRMILINSPNNPSGAVYTRETLDGIAAICRENDLWLVSDEVYDSQVYEGDHLSPASLPGMRERTLIVGSMSKSHAMTGWRVGWLVCPDFDAAERVTDLFLTTTYGMATFIQDAALAALQQGFESEQAIADVYRRRRDVAVGALSTSSRIKLNAPKAAMYVLIDIRSIEPSGEKFAYALLEAENVSLMPGESFGNSTAGHVRLSLCAEDAVLEDVCRRIAAFADGWET